MEQQGDCADVAARGCSAKQLRAQNSGELFRSGQLSSTVCRQASQRDVPQQPQRGGLAQEGSSPEELRCAAGWRLQQAVQFTDTEGTCSRS